MREVVAKKIIQVVRKLCLEASYNLSEDVLLSLKKALKKEKSPLAKKILQQIIDNAKIAWREKLPLCQDTGLAIIFIELGNQVKIIDGDLNTAINQGVKQGYADGYLRKSVAADPLKRQNSGANLPAIIHSEIVPGKEIRIRLLAKGGGAENMSALKMFSPYSPKEEITKFIVETIDKAGPNPCPPTIVGIGIGGSFDYAPILAKKALMRKVGQPNPDSEIAQWEKELLAKINQLGVGPMGIGGTTTSLAVQIEQHPCHISSLPVAVNLDCHAHRYKEVTI